MTKSVLTKLLSHYLINSTFSKKNRTWQTYNEHETSNKATYSKWIHVTSLKFLNHVSTITTNRVVFYTNCCKRDDSVKLEISSQETTVVAHKLSQTHKLNFRLISLFFQSYSRLGLSLKVNFWELLWQYFYKPNVLPETQPKHQDNEV